MNQSRKQNSKSVSGAWRVFVPYFRPHALLVLVIASTSFVTGIVESGLLLLVANVAFSLADVAATGSTVAMNLGPFNTDSLQPATALALASALAVLRLVGQGVVAWLSARLVAGTTASIRAGTFRDYATASWAEQSRQRESDIQDLLIRHTNLAVAGISATTNALGTIFLVAALLVSTFLVDWTVAAILLVSGAVLFTAVRPITGRAKQLSRLQSLAGRDYAARAIEAVTVSQEIRSFGVDEQVSERLEHTAQEEIEPLRRAYVVRNLVGPLYQFIALGLLIGGLWAINSWVTRPIADLGAIVVILVRAVNLLSGVQSGYHTIIESVPYVERLDSERRRFRDNPAPGGSVTIGEPAQLCFDRVSYCYDDSRSALSEISLTIDRGETIGVIGPSGSGKSTLIQILLRLRTPSQGTYLVNGVDAATISDDVWFADVAFVPQDSRVIEGTVADNICFFRTASRHEIETAAKRANLHDEIMAMPAGYDTELGSRGGALSGGQRQRLSIARALLSSPRILVLDEPTSALDMRSEALVHQTFTELKGRVTIIVIAHRLSTLNTCDRLMVLSDGRLQALGLREEIQSTSSFYRDALALSKVRDGTELFLNDEHPHLPE